jgi:hypothetical protein
MGQVLRKKSRIDQAQKKLQGISIQIYLLKGTELLLLHLHNALRDVMVPETLTELVPRESITISSWVGLPPLKSRSSQLPCCVKDSLPVVALRNNQLALHRAKPVVRQEWVRGVREGRRVTSQEICTPITGLRRRWRRWLSMHLLQSLNSVLDCILPRLRPTVNTALIPICHTRFIRT